MRGDKERNAVRPVATPSANAPGKLRCNDDRPAWHRRSTGACKSCGAAACVQQLRRSHGEAARACCPLQPQCVESAKQVNRSAGYAEGVRDAGETVLFLADTSWQWDFREFRVRRGQGFCGKETRDAVVCPVATSVHQSVGKRVPPWIEMPPWIGITGETHRALPWVRITGCGRRIIHSARQQFPRERSGEKSFNPSEQARADRDHAPRFLGSGNTGKARQHSQYPAPAGPPQGFWGHPPPITCRGLDGIFLGLTNPPEHPCQRRRGATLAKAPVRTPNAAGAAVPAWPGAS